MKIEYKDIMEHKLKIEYKDIDSLIPYINNTRTHSKEQIEQVKSSIKEFGMCTPIGIHNDTIVYGHARIQSMKELGYKEVPTLDLSHLTEAQKKAYIIADNKIALNAGWDEDLLKLELMELDDMGFDYSELGFDFEFDIEEINEDEDYSCKNKEINTDDYEDIMELKFKLSFAEYEEAREKLKEIANSPENALKILLKMEI